jgi:hypothetical protein
MEGGVVSIFETSFEHKGVLFEEVTVNVEGDIFSEDMNISSKEPISGVTRNYSRFWMNSHGTRGSKERRAKTKLKGNKAYT